MTACRAMRLRLAAYADDELGVEGAVEVESHLAQCASCRAEVERQRSFSRAVRDLYPTDAAPAGLEDRVRSALFGRRRSRAVVAFAALAASLALAVGAARFADGRRAPGIVADAAGIHRNVSDGTLAVALRTTSAAAVNDWLRRELPFPAAIAESRARGVDLDGASVVLLHGQRAGLVRYRVGGHAASLFLLPRRSWSGGRAVRFRDVEFRIFKVAGAAVAAWSHPPSSYLLVSDGSVSLDRACGACHGEAGGLPLQRFESIVASGA